MAGRVDKDMKLFAVTVLRAHNSRKGRAKASDRRIYVLGQNVIQVKDAVERGKTRVPGIKYILDVFPVGIKDLIKL